MAKGNLFLGMGRGKVGDVVFYRMNGWQMSRVRNRNPKNPRSNEQLYQRAVIATTMKAYSMGKEIFDHAFQGYTIGEGNMRRFNSVNARILRAQLVNDIQNAVTPDNSQGRFCAPRSVTGVPIIGMQVSEGTLVNNLFTPTESNGVYNFTMAPNPNEGDESIKVGDYLKYYGIQAGDIFTFVFMISDLETTIYQNPWTDTPLANQYNTQFAWLRLIVHGRNLDDEMKSRFYTSSIFDVESGGNLPIRVGTNGYMTLGKEVVFSLGIVDYAGTIACIRSRRDVDLRSTEFTYPYHSKDFGIASPYILDVWSQDVEKIGESELILEGGEGYGMTQNTTNPPSEGPSGQPAVLSENEEPITNGPEQESVLRKRGRTRA